MTNMLVQALRSVERVLRDKNYLSLFIILAAVFFAFLFQLQVITTPGNSAQFQIGLYGFKDWLLLIGISMANAIFITMQIYIARLQRLNSRRISLLGGVITSGIGTSSGVLASIFGTATCSLCVTALFSFLGANSVLFMVNNKDLITLGAITLLIISLIFTSRRFSAVCDSCRVK